MRVRFRQLFAQTRTSMKRTRFAVAAFCILTFISGCGKSAVPSEAPSKQVYFAPVARPNTNQTTTSVRAEAPTWLSALSRSNSIPIIQASGSLENNPDKYFADQPFLLCAWWISEQKQRGNPAEQIDIKPLGDCVIVCANGRIVNPVLVRRLLNVDSITLNMGYRYDLIFRLEKDDMPELFQSHTLKMRVSMGRPEGLSDKAIDGPWILLKDQDL